MSETITVHLVRHGESVWNVEGRYQGQADSGLTERGRRQAESVGVALAATVPTPDLLISSDLPRAIDTSTPYAQLVGARVQQSAALREIDVGDWAGRVFAEIAAEDPDTVAAMASGADIARGGGETFAQVLGRLAAGLDTYIGQLRAAGGDRTMVAVSHGGPIRLAAMAAVGVPISERAAFAPPDNCSVTTIGHHADGRTELVRYNQLIGAVTDITGAQIR